jgi:hypothetical protein
MGTEDSTEAKRSNGPDGREKLLAVFFLIGISVFAGIWFIPSHHPASVRIAAIGGSMAFFGVVLMAIPVLRVGPFTWIAHLYFRDIEKELRPAGVEHQQDKDQRMFDLFIQNIIGPYLIGIGTLLNGISGFF